MWQADAVRNDCMQGCHLCVFLMIWEFAPFSDSKTSQETTLDEHGQNILEPQVSAEELGWEDQQIRKQQAVQKASELIQKHRNRIQSSRGIEHATPPSRQQLVRDIVQRKREELALARKTSLNRDEELPVDNPLEASSAQKNNGLSSHEVQQDNIDNRHEGNGVGGDTKDKGNLRTRHVRPRVRVESVDRHEGRSRSNGRLSGWKTHDSLTEGDSKSRSQRRAFGTKNIAR